MKGTIGITLFGLVAVFSAQAGCGKSGGAKKDVAEVAQDTMLLRDLAEANRNTATADQDTTIAVIQDRGGSGPGALTSGAPMESPAPALSAGVPATQPQRPVARIPSRIPAPTRANDASAPMTVPTRTSTQGASRTVSDDPCDSPTSIDQRTCLNRSIATNDAELNRVYQDLVRQSRAAGGADLEERYRQSQRDWITRRDVECRQQNAVGEGRLWARGMARCLADYSNRRVPELQRSLNQLRGQ